MVIPEHLTNDDLACLALIGRGRTLGFDEATAGRLLEAGLVADTDIGFKMTGYGYLVLKEARANGRVAP